MARKRWKVTWKVTWRGRFPMDMLRYDRCWPEDTADAMTIARSLEGPNTTEHVAQITTDRDTRAIAFNTPTAERWRSFGAIVTDRKVR